jgi:hypothetical protein
MIWFKRLQILETPMSFRRWHRHQAQSQHAVQKRAVQKPIARRKRANAN